MVDFDEDEEWGLWDGQCQACDMYGRVNDMMLCESCADMLDRDLIRQRAWDYSASTWALSNEAREELRRKVIAEYGEKLELIIEEDQAGRKNKKRGRQRR